MLTIEQVEEPIETNCIFVDVGKHRAHCGCTLIVVSATSQLSILPNNSYHSLSPGNLCRSTFAFLTPDLVTS